MTALVFLDTETTGLRPDIHAIWEIAWATAIQTTQNELVVTGRFQSFIELTEEEGNAADPYALKVGGFYERYSAALARPPLVVMRYLRDHCAVVAEQGGVKIPHLCAAVPSFDHAMLTRWMGWPGFGEGPYHYHLVDVEALAAGKLNMAPPWDSDDLNSYLGIEVTDKHTAAGDVNWAMAMYAAVFNLTIKEP